MCRAVRSVICTLTAWPVLQKDIQKKKAELQKHAVLVKTQQKDMQTAALELGGCFG